MTSTGVSTYDFVLAAATNNVIRLKSGADNNVICLHRKL
jgi:hypothetical protein